MAIRPTRGRRGRLAPLAASAAALIAGGCRSPWDLCLSYTPGARSGALNPAGGLVLDSLPIEGPPPRREAPDATEIEVADRPREPMPTPTPPLKSPPSPEPIRRLPNLSPPKEEEPGEGDGGAVESTPKETVEVRSTMSTLPVLDEGIEAASFVGDDDCRDAPPASAPGGWVPSTEAAFRQARRGG